MRSQMSEYDQVAATMKRRKEVDEDAVLNELLYIRDRIGKLSGILTDKDKTAFLVVLTAEEMIINDTVKAVELFTGYGVVPSGYIVNRVLPDALRSRDIPEYVKDRFSMQDRDARLIEERFSGRVLARVHEMEREVIGLPMIDRMARALYGEF